MSAMQHQVLEGEVKASDLKDCPALNRTPQYRAQRLADRCRPKSKARFASFTASSSYTRKQTLMVVLSYVGCLKQIET